MSVKTVEEILSQRRFYPVSIGTDTIHLRAMKRSELKTVAEFQNEDESVGFAIGCALLREDGSQVYVRQQDESPKQFGFRVLDESDLPSDTQAELTTKILKLSQGPLKPDDLKKN